ncbi:hypothetical protein ACQP2F_15990 [Actinoplanes sp. CA-030573]|uniref:hypothetical protein n=1 Tax=Actinoplanes sp. CA-030573 TaxID=3239898 RepID=UPI003D8C08AF
MRRTIATASCLVALSAILSGCADTTTRPARPTASPTAPATTTATTTAPAQPVARRSTPPTTLTGEDIALRGNGLRAVRFGATPDKTLQTLKTAYGNPTADTGWKPSTDITNGCPGNTLRIISWGNLHLYFTDGPTQYAGPTRHFFAYNLTPTSDTTTPTNLSPGQTLAQLRTTYGKRTTITPTDNGADFTITLPEGNILGTATNPTPTGTITTIEAGQTCEN